MEYDAAGDPLGTLAPGRFILARRGVHSVMARESVVVMRITMPAYESFLAAHPEADVVAKAGTLRELPYFRHWGLTATRSMAYLFRAVAYGPGETVYSAFQAAAGPPRRRAAAVANRCTTRYDAQPTGQQENCPREARAPHHEGATLPYSSSGLVPVCLSHVAVQTP